jgi:pimeloyl-ACP methyl ester carboxylesterase
MALLASIPRLHLGLQGLLAAAALSACATAGKPPQLAPAVGAALASCADIGQRMSIPNTTLTSASLVAAGGLTATGIATPIPEHCLLRGQMNRRTSPVDGKAYAIGFEMRLPTQWNGRFFYQANGGLDGVVVPATGQLGGGAPTSNGLSMGFATMSSDAGHPAAYGPFFGLDPQARLDYGYQAVGSLTPTAKELIRLAYGKGPDRSYFAGCSNGGRHAMVAAARYADQYDGILAGNPGFNLPKAAVSQLWGVQQYASISTLGTSGLPEISTAFTPAEFKFVGERILARCDALDGASDGMVGDSKACQSAFSVAADVPQCTGARNGSCLTAGQKTVLAKIFDGPRNSAGQALYSKFWFDPGLAGSNYAFWEYTAAANLDPGAVAFIFSTPPSSTASFFATTGLKYGLNFSMDKDAPGIFATSGNYAASAMEFMAPPNPTNLSALKQRGGKMMVFHGVSDAVFSPADTASWYEGLAAANGGDAGNFARLFLVPGMNHCSGGPAADQFNMVSALVSWVEGGTAPDSVLAKVRGAGSNVVNTELPAGWSAGRTRPLCPYPKVAKYRGTGDIESAASFSCQ